jgi:hypothetical protein
MLMATQTRQVQFLGFHHSACTVTNSRPYIMDLRCENPTRKAIYNKVLPVMLSPHGRL